MFGGALTGTPAALMNIDSLLLSSGTCALTCADLP
jgi:hypothetical protein